jgi:DNA-binding response OmpR family regulator
MRSELVGHAILVVEDEPLIALDIADTLEHAGAHVSISYRLSEALGTIDAHHWSGAVLDYELPDGDCAPLCQRLGARGVPFVVHTGHDELPRIYLGGVCVYKPASGAMLVETLEQLLKPMQGASTIVA